MSAGSPDVPAGVPWPALSSHRAWLTAECSRLLDFAENAVDPRGGFAELDEQGRPRPHRPVQTWITARMTHVFALGHLLGRPGSGSLCDHGLAALAGALRDESHGGWFAAATPEGPVVADKRAYEHAFVVLACSSAAAAGRPGAQQLLGQALDVLAQHFWEEGEGLVVDVWDRTWSQVEPYRGVNANMHTVEALLAAADVTGDAHLRARALRIVERVVHRWARGADWHLPEHFDASWQIDRDYNRAQQDDPFRPYGVTIGHLFEWSRLCLHLSAALEEPPAPPWLLEDAAALFAAGIRHGWSVDGADGFVYTIDWNSRPVVRQRMHWVIAEAIAAAAALHTLSGEEAYEAWYRTWWDYAARYFLDRNGGSWHHELDPANHPAATVWQGKPDAYHAVQATLLPRLPLAPASATALRLGLLG